MTNKTYVNVTKADMDDFLLPQGFILIQVPGTMELVYAKRVDQGSNNLSLRVNTGINPDGNSRDCGADAMRVVLFMREKKADENGKPIVKMLAGSKKVLRIPTWRKNLQTRLDKWADECLTVCACGRPMAVRTAKQGDNKGKKFLGCTNYPVCKNTKPYED